MKLLRAYFDLQKQIYNHFGYVEDWVVIPLDDQTEYHWFVDEPRQYVVWSDDPMTEESIAEGMKIYGGPIYTQRFLPKWIYRADDYTMICVDTQTDGNKFLMVFDNAKEQNDQSLKDLHASRWGNV